MIQFDTFYLEQETVKSSEKSIQIHVAYVVMRTDSATFPLDI